MRLGISINEKIIKEKFDEALKKNGLKWANSQACQDWVTQHLQLYTKFRVREKEYSYLVFNFLDDSVYYVETEEEAETLVNHLIHKNLQKDLDGKIGYSLIKKITREFKGEEDYIDVELRDF